MGLGGVVNKFKENLHGNVEKAKNGPVAKGLQAFKQWRSGKQPQPRNPGLGSPRPQPQMPQQQAAAGIMAPKIPQIQAPQIAPVPQPQLPQLGAAPTPPQAPMAPPAPPAPRPPQIGAPQLDFRLQRQPMFSSGGGFGNFGG